METEVLNGRSLPSVDANEERYKIFFYQSADAMLLISNGRFVEGNASTLSMLGYSDPKEICNVHPSDLSPLTQPDGTASSIKAELMMQIAIEKGSHRFEWVHQRKDGSLVPVEVSLTRIISEEGEVTLHTVWRDISNREKAKEELRKSKEKYRFLLDNVEEIIWRANSDLTVTYINNFGRTYFGKFFQDVLKKGWLCIVHPDDRSEAKEIATQAIQQKIRYRNKFRVLTANGEYHWLDVSAAPKFGDDGDVLQWVGVAHDINEQVSTSVELVRRDERLQLYANASASLIRITDLNLLYQYIADTLVYAFDNKAAVIVSEFDKQLEKYETKSVAGVSKWLSAFTDLTGFPLVGIVGPIVQNTIKPLETGKIVDLGLSIHALSNGLVPQKVERIICKLLPPFRIISIGLVEGNTLMGNAHILVLDNYAGFSKSLVEAFIHEASTALSRLRALESLRHSELRFKEVVNSFSDVVFTLDMKERHTAVYGKWVDEAGLKPDFFLGKTAREVLGAEKGKVHHRANKRALKGEQVSYKWHTKRGETTVYYETMLSPLINEGGQIFGLVGVGRDITESTNYKNSLERQNERLQRVAWMQAHDLRGPLTRLMGLANLIQRKKDLGKPLGELIDIIQSTSNELDNVVRTIIKEAEQVKG